MLAADLQLVQNIVASLAGGGIADGTESVPAMAPLLAADQFPEFHVLLLTSKALCAPHGVPKLERSPPACLCAAASFFLVKSHPLPKEPTTAQAEAFQWLPCSFGRVQGAPALLALE